MGCKNDVLVKKTMFSSFAFDTRSTSSSKISLASRRLLAGLFKTQRTYLGLFGQDQEDRFWNFRSESRKRSQNSSAVGRSEQKNEKGRRTKSRDASSGNSIKWTQLWHWTAQYCDRRRPDLCVKIPAQKPTLDPKHKINVDIFKSITKSSSQSSRRIKKVLHRT